MNPTLLKAAIAFLPVSAWLAYSVVIFLRGKSLPTGLQLLGAGCLLLVVLTHVAEALRLFPTVRLISVRPSTRFARKSRRDP